MFAKFLCPSLTLLGVVCGAFTLFSNLKTFFEPDDRAHRLVVRWLEWTQAVWVWLSGLFAIQVASWLVSPLSVAIFLLLAMLGQRGARNNEGRATRSYAILHPFGWFGELAALLAMVAILYWGYRRGLSDGPTLHILLAQTAIMLSVFGIVGALNPEGFIKRVWIMLSVVAALMGSNVAVNLVEQRSKVSRAIISPLAAHPALRAPSHHPKSVSSQREG